MDASQTQASAKRSGALGSQHVWVGEASQNCTTARISAITLHGSGGKAHPPLLAGAMSCSQQHSLRVLRDKGEEGGGKGDAKRKSLTCLLPWKTTG